MAEPVYANEDPVRVVPVEGAKFFANKHPWRVVGDFDSLVEIHTFPTGDDIKTKKFYHLLDEIEYEGETYVPGIYYYDKETEEWRMLDESGFSVMDDFHSNPAEASRRRAVSERAISWARSYRGDFSAFEDLPEGIKKYHLFRADRKITFLNPKNAGWMGYDTINIPDGETTLPLDFSFTNGEGIEVECTGIRLRTNPTLSTAKYLDAQKTDSTYVTLYAQVDGWYEGSIFHIENYSLIPEKTKEWLSANGDFGWLDGITVEPGTVIVAEKDAPEPLIDGINWSLLYTGIVNDVNSDHLAASTLISPSEAAVSWARCYRGNIDKVRDLPENIKKYHIFRADNEIDFPHPIADIAGLTWVGNDTLTFLTPDPDQIVEYDITTQFGNNLWFNRTTHQVRSGSYILYTGDHWYYDSRKRLTFGTGSDSTNPKLINWLRDNGTFVDAEGVIVPEGALIVAEKDDPEPYIDNENWTLLYTGAAIDDVNSDPAQASTTLPSTERAISWARSYRGNFESLFTLSTTVEDIKKYHIFRANEDIDEEFLYQTQWWPKEGEVLHFPEENKTYHLDFTYATDRGGEHNCTSITLTSNKVIMAYNTDYHSYDTIYRDGEWIGADGYLFFNGTGADSANPELITWLRQGIFGIVPRIIIAKGDCVVAEKDKPAPLIDGINWTLLSTGEKENCFRGQVEEVRNLPSNAEKGIIYRLKRDNSYDDFTGATWTGNESGLTLMPEGTYYINFSIPDTSFDTCYYIRFEDSTVPGVDRQNIYYCIHESDGDWEAKAYDAETGWNTEWVPYDHIAISSNSMPSALKEWLSANGKMEGVNHVILPTGVSVASLINNPEKEVDGINWVALHTEAPVTDVNSNVNLASKDLVPTEAAVSWARCYKGNISSMEDLPEGIKKDHIFRFTNDTSVPKEIISLEGLTWRGNEVLPNDLFWTGRTGGGRFYIENDIGGLSYIFEGSGYAGGMNRIRYFTDISNVTIWERIGASGTGSWHDDNVRTWKITGGDDVEDTVLIKWMKENGVFLNAPAVTVPKGACIAALKDNPEPYIDDINWTILYTGESYTLVLPYQDVDTSPYTAEESRVIYERPENVIILVQDPEDPDLQHAATYAFEYEEDGIRLFTTAPVNGKRYGVLIQVEKDGGTYTHVASLLDTEPTVIDDVNSDYSLAQEFLPPSERAVSWARCYKGDITERLEIPDEMIKAGHILRAATDVEFTNYGNSNYTFSDIVYHLAAKDYLLNFSYNNKNCMAILIKDSLDPVIAGEEIWYVHSGTSTTPPEEVLVYNGASWVVPEAKEIKFKPGTRAFPTELEEWFLACGTFTNTTSTIVKEGNCIAAQRDNPQAIIDGINWVELFTAEIPIADDVHSDLEEAHPNFVPSERAVSWARCYRGNFSGWRELYSYYLHELFELKKGHIFRATEDIDQEIIYSIGWEKAVGPVSFETLSGDRTFYCTFSTVDTEGSATDYSDIRIYPSTETIRAFNQRTSLVDTIYEEGSWKIGTRFYFDQDPGTDADNPGFIAWLKDNGSFEGGEGPRRLTVKKGECIVAERDNPLPEIKDGEWVILHTGEVEGEGLIVLPYKDGVHEAYTAEEASLILENPERVIILTDPDDTKDISLAAHYAYDNIRPDLGGTINYETFSANGRKYAITMRIDRSGGSVVHVLSIIKDARDMCYRGDINSFSDTEPFVLKGHFYRAAQEFTCTGPETLVNKTITFGDELDFSEIPYSSYGNLNFTVTGSPITYTKMTFDPSDGIYISEDGLVEELVYTLEAGWIDPEQATMRFLDGADAYNPTFISALKKLGTFDEPLTTTVTVPAGACIIAKKDDPVNAVDNVNWALLYTNEASKCYHGNISSMSDLPADVKKGDIYRVDTEIEKVDYSGSTLQFNSTLTDHEGKTYNIAFSNTHASYTDLYVGLTLTHDTGGLAVVYKDSPVSGMVAYQNGAFSSEEKRKITFAEGVEIPEELLTWFEENGIFTNVKREVIAPEGACIVAEKDNPEPTIDGTNWTLLHTEEVTKCYHGNISSMNDLPANVKKGDIYRASAEIKNVDYTNAYFTFGDYAPSYEGDKEYDLDFSCYDWTTGWKRYYGIKISNTSGFKILYKTNDSGAPIYETAYSGLWSAARYKRLHFNENTEIPAELKMWLNNNGTFYQVQEVKVPEGACIVAEKNEPMKKVDGTNWTLLHTEEQSGNGITVLPYKNGSSSNKYTAEEVAKIIENPQSVVIETSEGDTTIPFSTYFANSYYDSGTGLNMYRFTSGGIDEDIAYYQELEIRIFIDTSSSTPVHASSSVRSSGEIVIANKRQTLSNKTISVYNNIIAANTSDKGKVLTINSEGTAVPEDINVEIMTSGTGKLSADQLERIKNYPLTTYLVRNDNKYKCIQKTSSTASFEVCVNDTNYVMDVNLSTGAVTSREYQFQRTANLEQSLSTSTTKYPSSNAVKTAIDDTKLIEFNLGSGTSGSISESIRDSISNYPNRVILVSNGNRYRHLVSNGDDVRFQSLNENQSSWIDISLGGGTWARKGTILEEEPFILYLTTTTGTIDAASLAKINANVRTTILVYDSWKFRAAYQTAAQAVFTTSELGVAERYFIVNLTTGQYEYHRVENQTKITGGATTITTSNLTANRALVSNASGKVAVSAITATELGYLDNVTSNIQTQLNNKVRLGTLSSKTRAQVFAEVGANQSAIFANVTFSSTSETPGGVAVSTTFTVKVGKNTNGTYGTMIAENQGNGDTYMCYLNNGTPSAWVKYLTGNDIVIDTALSSTSTNPVQNKVINTALGTKQATITGGATTITSSNLTANRALISNASGKVAVSAATSTELGYLSGVTSAIQTQLNNKAGTAVATTSANGLMSSTDKTKLDGIAAGANKTTVDSALSSSSTNPVQNKVINTALNGKQATLVSGTNIKTVNGNSLLGSGNLVVPVDESSLKTAVLDMFFPVGTLYYSMDSSFNPNTSWGGTWSLIEAGRFIEATTTANWVAKTNSAGIPNITGSFSVKEYHGSILGFTSSSGCFVQSNNGAICNPDGGGDTKGNTAKTLSIDASKSSSSGASSVYGKSATVQPSSITAYIWRRTA